MWKKNKNPGLRPAFFSKKSPWVADPLSLYPPPPLSLISSSHSSSIPLPFFHKTGGRFFPGVGGNWGRPVVFHFGTGLHMGDGGQGAGSCGHRGRVTFKSLPSSQGGNAVLSGKNKKGNVFLSLQTPSFGSFLFQTFDMGKKNGAEGSFK